MTTVLSRPAPAALSARPNLPTGFGRLLRAELTKIRSVRSTLWTLALMLLVSVGISALISSLAAAHWSSAAAADRAELAADPLGTIFGAMGYAELVVCVLGALVITSEYSSGTVRASLLAVPTRAPMLVAKAVVFGAVALVAGELAGFGSFFVGAQILHRHAPVSLGDPGVLRAVAGTGLFLAAMGLFALSVSAVIRHTAGAVASVIGFVLVLSPLASTLPGSVGAHVSAYLPTNAGQLIIHTHRSADALLGPWQGFGVCLLWSVVTLGLASVLLKRRDV